MLKRLLPLFLLLALLWACDGQPPPAGVAAMVNGEPIYLHSIETLLDGRTPASEQAASESVEDMQRAYAQAFSVLLTHALVRQELRQRGIAIDEKLYESAMSGMSGDLGEEGLDGALAEASIRKDDWQRLFRDGMALEAFRSKILAPQIKVGLDEIRARYESRKADFRLPPHLRGCFLSAEEKGELEAMCEGISRGEAPDSPLAHCAELTQESLPSPWRDEQASIQAGSCGKLREEGGSWRTIAILSREKGGLPSLAEVYALVEGELAAEKERAAFDKWLEEKIKASSIEVAPALNLSLALGVGEQAQENGGPD